MKKIILMAALLMTTALMCACKSGSNLADAFDEDTVKKTAAQAIDLFNAKDFQAVIDMGSDEFKAQLTVEQFASVETQLDTLGAFDSVEKFVIAGQQDEAKKDYAVVVAVGKYANGSLQFSMAFDDQMKLIQFFVK